MGLPVLRGQRAPAITTGAILQPAETLVGDLVGFYAFSQGTAIPTINAQAGFFTIRNSQHDDGTTDGRMHVAYRVATADGGASLNPFTFSGNAAGQIAGGSFAIVDGTYDVSVLPPSNGASLTTNAVPNPPALAGLTGDYLVFALSAWHTTTSAAHSATVMPNYSNLSQMTGSHVIHMAIASRSLAGLVGATEDPGAWASDNLTPNGSISFTFAIKGFTPAGVTGSGSSTIGVATSSGTGTNRITRTAGSSSTGASTSSGAGTTRVSGSGSSSVVATSSGSGTSRVTRTAGSSTIGAATSSGAGTTTTPQVAGGGASSIAAATSSGTGTSRVAGGGASSIAAVTSTGAAAVRSSGAGSATASAATSTGSGDMIATGSGAAAARVTSSGVGTTRVAGAGSASVAPATSSGIGNTSDRPTSTGVGTSAMGAVTSSGAGSASVTGAGSSTVAAFTSSTPTTALVGSTASIIEEPRATAVLVSVEAEVDDPGEAHTSASIVVEGRATARVVS
jgi:hypothetical protein